MIILRNIIFPFNRGGVGGGAGGVRAGSNWPQVRVIYETACRIPLDQSVLPVAREARILTSDLCSFLKGQ
jgi:hypothetical protein